MNLFDELTRLGHEQVMFCQDVAANYNGIIAIHSTALGPAVGGTRFWEYAKEEDAIIDALRLARGMTYKCAAAGLPLGGGKAVILRRGERQDREALFRVHGRFIERLGGRYIAGEDVGTSPDDMEYMRRETTHVAGLKGRSGDPSPATARGVFRAMQAAARHRWGSDDLAGRTVAVQGAGHVGYYLMGELRAAGARLLVTDIDPARVAAAVRDYDATPIAPAEIYDAAADIFAPCALGGVINDKTIPCLRCEVVAGAANNQLLEARHGGALESRGITYVPDYVANAGGVINGCTEVLNWTADEARAKVEAIYDTVLEAFNIAATEGIPASEAADRLAERRLAGAL